ncbi:cytochrome d ubiquinol oxidase subunit II [Pseudomonas sp. NPDC090202]|uniref:cytochrome d ubiquinol oxidase subunit II n=1 Tax=unclassified Pseudomonas TaxID=196821 RepID=UPI0038189F47
MGIQGIDLSLIWAAIIAIGIVMYVIMDGFDLGIGILFPLVPASDERDVMMNTVAPVWDGNETWLVFGGAALYGAFPIAYSVILEALYLPLVLMLAGLIFRGVAFEFRFKASQRKRHIWDKAFIGGSVLATFCQGVVIGTYIAGIPVQGMIFTGGNLDWLAPFPLFCGLGLLVAYAALGSTWLLVKTEGRLEAQMRIYTRPLVWLLFAVLVVTSLWTALLNAQIRGFWLAHPLLLVVAAVLVLASLFGALHTVGRHHTHWPFAFVLLLMVLSYLGLALSVWPNIVPPSLSLWQAASPPTSQLFILIGALFILPIILMYTCWSYYVFRGKVRVGDAYH